MGRGLARVLARHEPATTNLFLHRLCRSAVSARGGALTGSLTPDLKRALAGRLLAISNEIDIVPMQHIAYRMAEIADVHRLSTLGAEAAAAAEHLASPLYVWDGDDGPNIRA